MKSFLQILLFILLSSLLAYPQWTNQNLVPDGNDLWSTFFVDDSTGWIVGSGGFIKKTTNAGLDWIQQNSGTTLTLKSVQFVGQNIGWIIGESGLILKTTDGGLSWFSLTSGTTQHLTDIHFLTIDTGYVTGFGGTILKTTNGGTNWTSLSSGITNDLYSMDFVNAYVGYAVGGGGSNRLLLKTIDGGTSWINKSSGIPPINGPCLAVKFIDAYTGFIGGGLKYSQFIYKTTDGGDTWVASSFINQPLDKKEINPGEQLSPYSYYNYVGINSIYFTDSNKGYASAGDENCYYRGIFITTDGGSTWIDKIGNHPDECGLVSVYVTSSGMGWVVGFKGVIFISEDDGNSWRQILSGKGLWCSGDELYTVFCTDENLGWAGGYRKDCTCGYGHLILKTTNGGKIWKTQLFSASTCHKISSIYFINENLGWAVGGYRTTDGGENWSSISIPGTSVFFINQDTGWVVKETSNIYDDAIFKTTDGGITWVGKSKRSSSNVFFADMNVGWTVGSSGISKSTDGGESWITKSNLTASYIRFYDTNIGMCVGGGAVLVSTDGGENWTTKSSPSLQTINFINPMVVWGYTSEGTIYKTTNFGDSWNAINVGLGYGNTSFFIDEYTGWVCGLSGTMFKYSVEPPPPPPPPIWSNQILVEDAGGTESSKALTFGQHVDATDSLDASLGEYELPPPPPSGIFDARFNLLTNPQVSSFIDYRDSTETDIIWTIIFQPSSAGYPITFSWDSTSFPEGTFYLKDRINGSFVNVNMKNHSSYVLTNPIITSLSIIYRGVSSIVNVNDEWNMISVPLLAEDMSLSNLFATATSLAYGFEDSYVTKDTLVGGKGYWLKFDGNQQVQIYGSRMGNTLPLETGWNMFGAYEEDIPVTQLTTTPPGIVATYFFEYTDGYYIADTLKSGKGFWVRVTEDGVLNLNSGGLIKDGEQVQFAEIDKNWGKIIITDNSGKSISLFADEEKIESNNYELPPIPPIGIFDARYSSGRIAENLSSEQMIQISSDNYPITIRAEGLNLTVKDIINGELLNEELKNGEEIRITNSTITSIEISGRITGGLPISYELYQNYPNPFNPGTTIKFAIPKESQVNLSIYNVLGELVSTLVNEEMKPGFYEIEFNASALATGVYLYRIKAGDFVETKKMVLLK